MGKRYLTKNEFRMDNNPSRLSKKGKPHPAYISAKQGDMLKANGVTHSRHTRDGVQNFSMEENPDKRNGRIDLRITRITRPYWQDKKYFSEKLENFHWSNKSRKQIKKFNKQFDKKKNSPRATSPS